MVLDYNQLVGQATTQQQAQLVSQVEAQRRVNESKEVVSNTPEITRREVVSKSPSSELSNFDNSIKRIEKQLDNAVKNNASEKTIQLLQNRLDDLIEARRNLIDKGLAYVETKREVNVSEGTELKDTIITPSGFQSKASFLQTPQEKERTNAYFATLQSNKDSSTGVVQKGDTFIKDNTLTVNRGQNGSTSNLQYSDGNSGSNYNSGTYTPTSNQGYPKDIQRAIDWQENQKLREERAEEFFRGKGGDSYIEEFGRKGITYSSKLITALPESIALAGYKAYLNVKYAADPATREATIAESKRALSQVPLSVGQGFNPTTPEGAVNIAGFIATPSVLGKGTKAIKPILAEGYEQARVSFIEPRVRQLERGEIPSPFATVEDVNLLNKDYRGSVQFERGFEKKQGTYEDNLNSQDIAVLGQRTIDGKPISQADINKANAPLTDNEIFGAKRPIYGVVNGERKILGYEVPEERIVIKNKKENLILSTGQERLVQDKLVAGDLEKGGRTEDVSVQYGEVFVKGKEFNPKTQTLITESPQKARADNPYEVSIKGTEKQLDLFGQEAKVTKDVELTSELDIFTRDLLNMANKEVPKSKSVEVKSSAVDNSDLFNFEPTEINRGSTRQVSSSKYANDKSFVDDTLRVSDSRFDTEVIKRYSVEDAKIEPVNLRRGNRLFSGNEIGFVSSNYTSVPINETSQATDLLKDTTTDIKPKSDLFQEEKPETSLFKGSSSSSDTSIKVLEDQGSDQEQKTSSLLAQSQELYQEQIFETPTQKNTQGSTDTVIIRVFEDGVRPEPRSRISREREEAKNNSVFFARVKKKGKLTVVGSADTKKGAFNIARRKIESDLSASGDVIDSSGRRVEFGMLPGNFRPSKKESNIFVQREGTRLDSREEVSQIQTAKRFSGNIWS